MPNKEALDGRSRYYQTIAKIFIDLRGAPFFLSSKELDMVRQWEERGIPLRVVLEGIRGSFERPGTHIRKRRKPYTLDSCNSFVLRAFDLYEDRCVGEKNETAPGPDKSWTSKILSEVERFLSSLPEELDTLKPVFSELQEKLSGGKITEEELEKAEETIERLIEGNLSGEQVQTVTAEIWAEFGTIRQAKFDEIFRIKALKATREKHKIPHVSPFYY